ncbi:MAG: hypothetical protein ACJAXY_002159 [Nonlabens sp.]|jgi:hypothetical protein
MQAEVSGSMILPVLVIIKKKAAYLYKFDRGIHHC